MACLPHRCQRLLQLLQLALPRKCGPTLSIAAIVAANHDLVIADGAHSSSLRHYSASLEHVANLAKLVRNTNSLSTNFRQPVPMVSHLHPRQPGKHFHAMFMCNRTSNLEQP